MNKSITTGLFDLIQREIRAFFVAMVVDYYVCALLTESNSDPLTDARTRTCN